MKNLQAYKKQIKEIETLIDKLEKGDLDLEELIALEKLTRELHEKSIILKYKAFESHVNGEITEIVDEESADEDPIEDPIEEPVEEETPDIDFSIFESVDSSDEPEEEEPPIKSSL